MSSRTTSRQSWMGKAVAIAVLGLAGTAVATPAHADPVAPVGTGATQEIRNQQNTLCLDDYQLNTSPGAEARQWTCHDGVNQQWAITDLGTGYAEIKNTYSNLCLDNFNNATAPGSQAGQWTCHGGTNQQWELTDAGGGWTQIKNRSNGLCLESEAAPLDGTLVSQQTCTTSGQQRWRITDPNVSKVTWELERVANPNADELDAYDRITVAMNQAVARWNKFGNTWRHLTIRYDQNVQTAEAWGSSGLITFGGNRHYMQEGFALHEMNHAFGTGTSGSWGYLCDNQLFPAALPLLRSWDGPDAKMHCGSGGIHFAPYGLNYSDEFSETAFDRNVRLVQALHHDGV